MCDKKAMSTFKINYAKVATNKHLLQRGLVLP